MEAAHKVYMRSLEFSWEMLLAKRWDNLTCFSSDCVSRECPEERSSMGNRVDVWQKRPQVPEERGGDRDDVDNDKDDNTDVQCSLRATRLDILFMPEPGVREQDSGIAGGLGVRKWAVLDLSLRYVSSTWLSFRLGLYARFSLHRGRGSVVGLPYSVPSRSLGPTQKGLISGSKLLL